MLVHTEQVTRRFGDTVAVDAVDMALDAGEVVGLLGANGAGKTTLVKLILGLLAPTSGTVMLLDGHPSSQARTRVGYLPQGLGLYEDLTIAEHLAFTARLYGYDRPTGEQIPGDTGRPIATLSLGARRLAAFAAATGHDPALLLLDEPTSGVDPLGRARLWDRIHEHAEQGRGVLVTTHHLAEAEQCDRLVVMAAGRVVASGSLDDVLRGHHAVAVDADDWHAAFAALDAASLPVVLDGRRLRVINTPRQTVASALASAAVDADTDDVAATLEEVFVELARQPAA